MVKANTDEALAIIIQLDLSQRQYKTLRNILKTRNAPILPCYDLVLEAKKRCVPPGLEHVRPGVIEIPLQSVLDHQTSRLLAVRKDLAETIINMVEEFESAKFEFHFKYGGDASTDYKQYNTKDDLNHRSLYCTHLVPVLLRAEIKGKHQTLYINQFANSAYGVSYLRIAMEKEDFGAYESAICMTL